MRLCILTMMLLMIKTNRTLATLMLVVSLVAGSGYTSALAICCATEGPIRAELISPGCCYCPDGEAHDVQSDDQIIIPHKHCVDLELPANFLTIRIATRSAKSRSAMLHPLLTCTAADTPTSHIHVPDIRNHPPWHEANHQTVTLLSSTVLLL